MKISLNGEIKELDSNISLQDLVRSLNLACSRIAVEKNGNVISKEAFASTCISDGDRFEIITLVGGG